MDERKPSMRLLRTPSPPSEAVSSGSQRDLAWWPSGGCEMKAFTIQAAKDGQTVTTVRIGSLVCVEKAKRLLREGWQVHITDAAGQQYAPDQFDQLLPSETAFLPQRDAS